MDDKFYYPADVKSVASKVFRKIGTPFFLKDYNRDLLRAFESFDPDIVCVYKGASLQKESMLHMKGKKVPIFCVYPDTNFFDFGPQIPSCIPYYDFIFTTKSFGTRDLKSSFNYLAVQLIQHSADPDIHRIIHATSNQFSSFQCDASFIGSHSEKKENYLKQVIQQERELDIKIWGNNWNRSKSDSIASCWQKQPVYGDLYAIAIGKSKVNIALLLEASKSSVSGDLITSRTFHIPGAGGFMLHERTDEFLELFEEGKHAACFSGPEELADKIRYYTDHETERKAIAAAGHELVMNHHTSDHRAAEILNTLTAKGILKTPGA